MKQILIWELIHFSNLSSGDYIGQKLREKSFDPKGNRTSTVLDDLVKITEGFSLLSVDRRHKIKAQWLKRKK